MPEDTYSWTMTCNTCGKDVPETDPCPDCDAAVYGSSW